jgi:hypothetical protein
MELWLWTLTHLQEATDADGGKLYHGNRQGVTFPLADALCWLLASRYQILDLLELEAKGPENPVLAEGLPGFQGFLTDLCHVQAARAAGEAGRVCAELVYGYNRHAAWDGGTGCGPDACDPLVTIGVDASGATMPVGPKAGPCVRFDGMEAFVRLRLKLDGCLTGVRLAKDRAAEALTKVMIPGRWIIRYERERGVAQTLLPGRGRGAADDGCDIVCVGFRGYGGSHHACRAASRIRTGRRPSRAARCRVCRRRSSATSGPTTSASAFPAWSPAREASGRAFPIWISRRSRWPHPSRTKPSRTCWTPSAPAAAPRSSAWRTAASGPSAGGCPTSTRLAAPYVPPFLRKDGGLLFSIGQFNQWVGAQVMGTGVVQIWPGMPVAKPLWEDGRVGGVRLTDQGTDLHGRPEAGFLPGMDIRAALTVIGDGPVGPIGRQIDEKLGPWPPPAGMGRRRKVVVKPPWH